MSVISESIFEILYDYRIFHYYSNKCLFIKLEGTTSLLLLHVTGTKSCSLVCGWEERGQGGRFQKVRILNKVSYRRSGCFTKYCWLPMAQNNYQRKGCLSQIHLLATIQTPSNQSPSTHATDFLQQSIMFNYIGYVLNLKISSPGSGINSLEIYTCIFRFGLDICRLGFESSTTRWSATRCHLYFHFNKTTSVWERRQNHGWDLLVKHYNRFNAGNLLEELNMFLGEFVA